MRPSALALALALVALTTAPGSARAEPQILGICQSLLGDEVDCEVATSWGVEKVAAPDYLLEPEGDTVGYTIRVTEGETVYTLQVGTTVELTGLLEAGTRVRGLIVSLQKGSAAAGYTTIASARYGEFTDTCGCPWVDNGHLDVEVRDQQGEIIPAVQESIVEFLGWGERVTLRLGVSYDLGAGIVLPGDEVRVQTCVSYASVDDLDLPGCAVDGGSTRTVRACSPFAFEEYVAPKVTSVTLTEALGTLDVDFARVWGFVAEVASGSATPAGPLELEPGGEPLTFTVAPTGVAGSESLISVTGNAACEPVVTCADPEDGLCLATLTNEASLALGDDPVSAFAAVTIACGAHTCDEVSCDDQDPCTVDTCTPGIGCTHEPATGPSCEDGDPCTMGDVCEGGACVGGPAMDCEGDDDPCTVTWCDPVAGCVTGWAPIGTPCDDGDACTVGETCKFGGCFGGEPYECPDTNPCAVATCTPATGCAEVPITGPCDDGDACTEGGTCLGGACVTGPGVDCDDDDPCTADTCDPDGSCVHTALSDVACEDGDLCTVGDVCEAGVCVPGGPETCGGDGSSCAVGVCDPDVGCVFDELADGAGCDDGDACTGCPWTEAGVARGFDVFDADTMAGFQLPGSYVVWLTGFYGGKWQVRMRGLPGLRFLVFDDHSAVLRGQVEVFDTGGGPEATDEVYDLEVHFAWRGVGSAGQGLGGPHRELGLAFQGFAYTDSWRYWSMTGGTLRSTTSDNWAQLSERPWGGFFPWQLGMRANNRNLAFGASSWLTFTHHMGAAVTTGPGDINVDLVERFCDGPDVCVAGECVAGGETLTCSDPGPGDYCSWGPAAWTQRCGASGGPSCILSDHFKQLRTPAHACSGKPTWTVGFTLMRRLSFTTVSALRAFIDPDDVGTVTPGPTLSCDPPWQLSDAFSKDLVAARLNVELSDLGALPAPWGTPFGDLVLTAGECAGRTVRDVVHRAEMAYVDAPIDGPVVCKSAAVLHEALTWINGSFEGCEVQTGLVAAP